MGLKKFLLYYVSQRFRILVGYPVGGILFSSGLALFVLGLFILFISHAARFAISIKDSVSMQLYLHDGVKNEQFIHLDRLLCGKGFVLVRNSVPQVRFISKDVAARNFIKDSGIDFYEVLDQNPFRDSFVVGIDSKYHDREVLRGIKGELEGMRGVLEVDYVDDFVESVNKNIFILGSVLLVLAVCLFVVVILVVANVIRFSIYSQRFFIRTMGLVGATDKFIRWAFMIRSIVLGIISASLVSVVLLCGLAFLNLKDDFFAELQDLRLVFGAVLLIHVISVCVLGMSSRICVNKYLSGSFGDIY